MNKAEEAARLFGGSYNCAQSVFSVFVSETDCGQDTALKIASPFGSGMARMGGVCGAVSGALMAIGLKYGMGADGDGKAKEQAYAMARDFARQFSERNTSVYCRSLIGYDLDDPEQYAAAKEEHVFDTLCARFVTDAVQILEKIIQG